MFRHHKRTLLRTTSMLTGAMALGAVFYADNASAQETTSVDEIVVTGSRLARPDLSAPSPITVVGQEDIANSGATTIESIVNELPQLSAGNTSSVNSGGGAGVLTANLRGLGANRTLTLVNGRRFIPANGAGNVDLGTIPSALVKRVEIITGGASAVYGSDAIAGAVNFILRDDIDGIEAAYQYGITGEGDGENHKYELTFGSQFGDGRGNIILHGNYLTRDGVMMEDRDFSRVPLDSNTMGVTGSGNIPGGRIALSAAQLASLDLGNGAGVLPRNPSCTAPQNAIRFGDNGEVLQYCSPEDTFNYADGNFLLRPFERQQFTGLVNYDVSDRVQAFAEFHYVNSRNHYQQASDSLNVLTPDQNYFEVVNYATNPVLSAAVRDLFVRNSAIFDPNNTGNARISGGILRRFDELGLRTFSFERATVGTTGGLRGSFDMGGNNWNWEIFGQYQRSRTDETVEGMMSPARLGLGLDTVVNGQNQVVCANNILGCVPVNPFGLGSITPEAAAFITPHRSSTDEFERSVFGGSIAGTLFELPAGPLSTALGFEHRSDDYQYLPGATDLAREYGSSSRGTTAGGYEVTELFGEVRVPILAGMAYVEELTFEGAVRYSEYSNFGGSTTWKAGLEWAPNDWLRFRTAYNVANRAPSISELYAPVTVGYNAGSDPCAAASNPSAAQKALCVQQGVPQASIDNFVPTALGFNQRSGGNPNLQEETSETFTAGFVARVPWVDRLNVAIDYFKIEVEDAVATLSAADTLRVCYQLLDINSAPCQAISRIPGNGEVFEVNASSSNIGVLSVEGVDLSADWGTALPDSIGIGSNGADLSITFQANWMFERISQLVGAQPIDCAGVYGSCTRMGAGGTPAFKANLGFSYLSGPLSVRNQFRYIDKLDPMVGVNGTNINADAVAYWDISASYALSDRFEVFGGFNNLLDQEPRILGQAHGGDSNTDVTLYDPLGRSGFIGIRAKF